VIPPLLRVLLRYWLPVVLCCATIVFWSGRSTFPFSLPSLGFARADLLWHFLEYLLLGLLTTRLFARGVGGLYTPGEALVVATLFGLGFGALDEVHQLSVPGRSVDLLDWLADGIGTLAAVGAYALLRLRRPLLAGEREAT